jgi:hypothetical protein
MGIGNDILLVMGVGLWLAVVVEFFHIGWLVRSSRNLLREILAELRKPERGA